MKAVKTTYHHGDLEQTLLNLALEAVESKGPDDLSMRELAREAGVSPNAPYRHFETKEALLLALIRKGFEDLAQELDLACHGGSQELEAMGEAYTRFASARPALFRLMFSGRLPQNPGESFRAMSILGDAVRRRLPEGANDVDVVQAALAAWSLVHGAAVLQMEGLVAWARPEMLSMDSLSRSIVTVASPEEDQ